ncbi:MAG: peptide chain release factor N(5)-glutamine methyltransferase [Bacilli bacterium]|nr:peptide chain release factor N(5)-glutamine methyltransferase [Bacilli bacterium]
MNNISKIDLELLKQKYQGESLDIALNKVNEGYPVQYLIGNVNFCGNIINVNENVLIPRYETEFLVQLVLKNISKDFNGNILDIGTGSGCISISIAKELTKANITGIDVSKKAIELAVENKNINKTNNVKFEIKDLFEINNLSGYEIIVSNPPYVSYNEEVGFETKYEPQNAIFADNNGLVFYEEIIKKVSKSKNIKHIFFEIGMTQAKDIMNFKKEYLPEYKMDVYKDLAGKDRYIHIYE